MVDFLPTVFSEYSVIDGVAMKVARDHEKASSFRANGESHPAYPVRGQNVSCASINEAREAYVYKNLPA
jgi:hypothetical protein